MTVDGSQKPSDLRRNLTFKAPPLPPTTRSCYLFSASLGALMAPRRLSTTRRLRPRSRHPPLCSQRRHRPPTVVARPPSRPPMSSLPLDRFHAFVDGLVDGASRSCPPRETYLDSSNTATRGTTTVHTTAHITLHATTPAHTGTADTAIQCARHRTHTEAIWTTRASRCARRAASASAAASAPRLRFLPPAALVVGSRQSNLSHLPISPHISPYLARV